MEVFIVNSILNHAHFYFCVTAVELLLVVGHFRLFPSKMYIQLCVSVLCNREQTSGVCVCTWVKHVSCKRARDEIEGVVSIRFIQYRKICNYKHCLNKKKGRKKNNEIKENVPLFCVSVVGLHVIHSIGCHLKTVPSNFISFSQNRNIYKDTFRFSVSRSKFNLFGIEILFIYREEKKKYR